MTYAQAIARLDQKLRDSEAWPSGATKLSEQLFLLYNAALAVLKGIPIDRLQGTLSSGLAPTSTGHGAMNMHTPPASTFFYRGDWGISHFVLDGKWYMATQILPVESLISVSAIEKHSGRALFSIDRQSRTFYSVGVTDFKVSHFLKPPLPTVDTADYPLADDNDFELAMTIVAAHVTGETIRDGAQSQFQSFLSLIYGDDNRE